jgi:hypothetical protein
MSTINYSGIDQLFPIAGQDNDSQGFRDNFATIKTGLQTAHDEITELQTKSILVQKISPDTGPVVNDLQSSMITSGSYKDFHREIYTHLPGDTIGLDVTLGDYQIVTLNGETSTITFSGWPQASTLSNGLCPRVIVEMTCAPARAFVNPSLIATAGTIKYIGGMPSLRLTKDADAVAIPKIIEAWSPDEGVTVYVRYIGEFMNASNGLDPIPNAVFNGDVTLDGNDALLSVPFGEVSASIITAVTTANLGNTTVYDLNVTNGALLNAVTVNGAITAQGAVSIAGAFTTTANTTLGNLASTASADIIRFNGVPKFPIVTSAQRDTLSTVKEVGMIVFNSDNNCLELCQNDATWRRLDPESGIEQLTTGNAVNLTKETSWFATSGASTATLSAGFEGQIKRFVMTAESGNMVITLDVGVRGWGGAGTMTFNDIGDGCTLQFVNGKWYCVGNNGVVLA